jgi:uncharacterized membrane protein (UPF0127 family)
LGARLRFSGALVAAPAVSSAVAFLVALVVAGCTSDPADRRSLSPDEIPPSLVGRPLTFAEIGDVELQVAVADTPDSRRLGLMRVDDFGAVDGMVFVYDAPTETSFYMKDVLVPLDIAFVGADGTVLEVLTMALCPADPCPLYRSPAPIMWAIETPAGVLAGIRAGDRFVLRPWGG